MRGPASRAIAVAGLASLSLLPHVASARARFPQGVPPPPTPRVMSPASNRGMNPGMRPNSPGMAQPVHGAHLGQWMQQHSNLNPQQQQRALENEPGFRSLPPGVQQNVMNRLNRLNSMPEQQRERVIQRNEAFEHMTPDQRMSVRSAMGQLGSLPPDRRHAVSQSFRELRSMPPEERNALLNSPQFRQQFNDEERGTLGNLLAVSPLLPPSR
jgi:hypothetical protein